MDFYDIPPPPARAASTDESNGVRPFLGISFDCCKVYARVYRNAPGTHYVGNCPRCARQVRFKIGTEGSGARFWTAT